MRQFMSNEEKRAWKAAEAAGIDHTPSEWIMAEVKHNNHLNETFVVGMTVYTRRDGEGWLVVRVTPSTERIAKIFPAKDQTCDVVRLNSDTKAKWSLESKKLGKNVWHLNVTEARAVELVVEAWKQNKLAVL